MDKTFWQGQPKAVARSLLGKSLICGDTEAVILKAAGYSRAQNEGDGLYRPLIELPPGAVYCPRRRNAVLLLIVTADGKESGGCVLMRTVEVGGVIYDGPGRVTNRLGLNEHGTSGRTEWLDDDTFVVRIEGVPAPRALSKHRPSIQGNGIGKEVLESLMPRIVNKYLAEKPAKTFHSFLSTLLGECANVAELRKRLR